VADSVEDQVPSPSGGTGDGNGDGVPDAQQSDVASLPNAVDGGYVTLVSGGGIPLQAVRATAPAVMPPAWVEMPQGLITFQVDGLTPGSVYSATLILHTGAAPVEFWKFGPTLSTPTDHWYPFMFDGQTGAVIGGNTITLYFVDGQRGDGDLSMNGRISDPGGPALRPFYGLWMPQVIRQPSPTPTSTPTVTPTMTPTPTATSTPTATPVVENLQGQVIPGLAHPNGIAMHQGQNRLFLTSRDNNRLLKINPENNAVVAQADTGAQPWGVAVNEVTNRVYVSNHGGADVWVYDGDSLARVAVIRLGNPGETRPGQMVVLPAINTVAVAVNGNGSGVAIIEDIRLAHWAGSGGRGIFGIAADPVRNRVIVSNRDGGNMQVLYRTEFGQWKSDGQSFTFSDRRIPFAVAFNPVNGKLYLLHVINLDWAVQVWELRGDGWFWPVTTVSVGNSGLSRDPMVGGMGLTVNTTTGHLFVANSADNTVSVIDGGSNQVITTLATGPDPVHIAANPITRMVYLALRSGNRLAWFVDR
jgi:YVTN family beta-propeller protein